MRTHTFGGPDNDEVHSVKQTVENGTVIAGQIESFGLYEEDCYLIKLDASGDMQWQGCLEGVIMMERSL